MSHATIRPNDGQCARRARAQYELPWTFKRCCELYSGGFKKLFFQIAREAFQGHYSGVLKSILALQLESKHTNDVPVWCWHVAQRHKCVRSVLNGVHILCLFHAGCINTWSGCGCYLGGRELLGEKKKISINPTIFLYLQQAEAESSGDGRQQCWPSPSVS